MILALFRGFAALSLPELRRIVGLSFGIALTGYVALWIALGLLLHQLARFGWRPIDWAVELLGAVAVLVLSWLLFPAA